MVTYERLLELVHPRGFKPFWVKLLSGEVISVNEPYRALAVKTQLLVTTNGRTMRFVPLSQIASATRMGEVAG